MENHGDPPANASAKTPLNLTRVVVYADEAGSSVPGNMDHSVFLTGAVLVEAGTSLSKLEGDIKARWESGKLREKAKGNKATDAELDEFSAVLCDNEVIPSGCFVRHHEKGFAEAFRKKVEETNERALLNLWKTGANVKYMPAEGHRIPVMLWGYMSPMAVGIGLATVVALGARLDDVEVHIDRLKLRKESRDLVLDQLEFFLHARLIETARVTLSMLGNSSNHLPPDPKKVSVDFGGSFIGRYVVDYLCSIMFRAKNTFDLRKHNTRWFDRLQEKYCRLPIITDVTETLRQPPRTRETKP